MPMNRRAKIAATLGPACDSSGTLTKMVRGGLDVARLNFSHGDKAAHYKIVRQLRAVAKKCGKPIPLLADLQGPRFRIGELAGGSLELEAGAAVVLVAGKRRCEPGSLSVTYAALARDVKRGDRVLIDTGTYNETSEWLQPLPSELAPAPLAASPAPHSYDQEGGCTESRDQN